jgi:hypothetical protein
VEETKEYMNTEAWMFGDNDGELLRNLRNMKRTERRIMRSRGEYNMSSEVMKKWEKTRKYPQWLHYSSTTTSFSFRLNSQTTLNMKLYINE